MTLDEAMTAADHAFDVPARYERAASVLAEEVRRLRKQAIEWAGWVTADYLRVHREAEFQLKRVHRVQELIEQAKLAGLASVDVRELEEALGGS